ncbi:MAG: hypothetical protein V3T65_07525 [Acidobacteriota bacterium]
MPDYIYMLESRLSPEQTAVLNRVQQEAQDAGLNVYLAGGAVRDLMTGAPIRDLDFVFEGNPLRLARRLSEKPPLHLQVNDQLRSAELVLANSVSLSLEMARSETFHQPGKPPEVKIAPILDDLRRRDLTLNAMGISLTPGSRGLLLDPTNGLADIENHELRILHNYSFLHDPIRILRLVRFTARLSYKPETRTREQFNLALERGYADYIESASLGREMEQIAREENVVAVLKALQERELLAAFHPRLQKRKPDYDGLAKFQKYRQQAEEAGYLFDPFHTVMHYVLRRLSGGEALRLLRKLGAKKTVMKQIESVATEGRKLVRSLGRLRPGRPKQVYGLLTSVPIERLIFALAEYSSRQTVQAKIYNYLFKYRPLRKKLPVRELQLMGVATGPKFDQILEQFFAAQLDGKIRSRSQQLRFLRNAAGLPKPVPKQEEHKKEKEPAASKAAAGRPTPAPPPAKAAAGKPKPAGQKAAVPGRKAEQKARKPARRRPGKSKVKPKSKSASPSKKKKAAKEKRKKRS